MHSSRVPLSFEVACSYFSNPNQLYKYEEVREMRDDLNDLLKDYHSNELLDQDMDFYYPRSYFIAESIIKSASKDVLKEVMNKVIDRVPTVQIYNYHTFKSMLLIKALLQKHFLTGKKARNFMREFFCMTLKTHMSCNKGHYICL